MAGHGHPESKGAVPVKALGRHVLAELYDCDAELLSDLQRVRKIMVDAALEAGAEVREAVFHQFSPQGVSGVVVISESHLAVHTWPEYGYASIDVFTCGERVDPWDACRYVAAAFAADRVTATEARRGILQERKAGVAGPSGVG